MSNETKLGHRLVIALERKLATNNESYKDLAFRLGKSYAYIISLLHKDRPLRNMDYDFLRKCAEYLEIPLAQAFLLADILAPTDFQYHMNLESIFDKTFRDMSADPIWSGYCPHREEWEGLSQTVKMLIHELYKKSGSDHSFIKS